jgi:hypothetical protein
LAAAILVALLGALALPGLSQSSQGPMATASVVPKNGVYQGRTGQGLPISLTVRRHRFVTRVQFSLRNNCGGRSTITLTPAPPGFRISSAGRFRYDSSTTDISGRFVSNQKVRGAVSNTTTLFGPFGSQTCRGATTYVARH